MNIKIVKPVRWVASSKDELNSFPRVVRREVGYAIHFAQMGDKHPSAKPLKGFEGAGVLEIVEDFDRNTYRAVYTLKLSGIVYVLMAFQKKSTKGIETPKHIINLLKNRFKAAQEDYKKR